MSIFIIWTCKFHAKFLCIQYFGNDQFLSLPFFSASTIDKIRKDANGWDSLDEEISAAEEKKHGIKNFIKRRLRTRSSTIRHAKKDGSTDPTPNNSLEKQSQSDKPLTNGTHSLPRKMEVNPPTKKKQKTKDCFTPQINNRADYNICVILLLHKNLQCDNHKHYILKMISALFSLAKIGSYFSAVLLQHFYLCSCC